MKNRVIPNAFTINERDRRWGLARQIMQANDLEVLMVYGDRESAAPAPFCIDHYFTNDRLGSVVLFHLDKAPVVVTFAPMMVADHMQAAMRGDMQWIAPEQIVVGKTGHNIAQVLIDLGVSSRANIGVIGLEPYPPFYFDGAMPFNTLTGIKKDCQMSILFRYINSFSSSLPLKVKKNLSILSMRP